MKIETQALEDRQTKITAELDAEAFEQYKRRAARKISQQAKVPGFRPGKAPYEVIRRMYGDPAIQQEAIELMVDELYPQILKEANVEPSGPGNLSEVISMDPPRLSFIVPLAPEITLGDYNAMRKEYAPEPVTDEMVEKAFLRLQRTYATAEPVERAAQEGDLVAFKMSAKRLMPAEGESENLLEENSYQMVVGEDDEEKWPYEGFTLGLAGLSANDSKTWTHLFDESTPFEDLRGIEVEFAVTAESVKELKLPEVNDEFAHTVSPQFETVDSLRSALRTQLEQNYTQQYQQNYYEELINKMVEESTVAYPPHLLDEEVDQFLKSVEHDLSHQNMDLDTYLKLRDLDRETFIKDEVKPAAERRLRRSLVMGQFAELEKVEVTEQETRQIFAMAMQQGEQMGAQGKQTKKSQQDTAVSLTSSTVNNLFNQRVMDRMKAIASPSSVPAEGQKMISIAELLEQDQAARADAEGGAEGDVVEVVEVEEVGAEDVVEVEIIEETPASEEAPAEGETSADSEAPKAE